MMNSKWNRRLKWLLWLALPIGLGVWLLVLREQRSWLPQVICKTGAAANLWVSPDGNWLATHDTGGSRFPKTLVLDTRTGAVQHKFSHEMLGGMFAFSPDSKQFVIEDIVKGKTRRFQRRLNFYDTQTGKVLRRTLLPNLNSRQLSKLVWSMRSHQIFALGDPCFIVDSRSGKITRILSLTKNMIKDFELSPDGAVIAGVEVQGKDRNDMERTTIRLWNAENGKLLRTLQQKVGRSDGIAFSTTGNLIAADLNLNRISFNANPHIQIWNARTGQKLSVLRSSGSSQTGFYGGKICFSPTANLLSAPVSPDSVVLYNADTKKVQRTLLGNLSGYLADTGFSPDGKFLFTLKQDGTITRWRIR